jgi:sigma-B regulation protein RsbU (phosphoserine phosphatase)
MSEQMNCLEVWGGNQGAEQHFHMPGLDVWLYSRPAENAANGGDVYYLSSCASGRISRLLVADVSGHGARVSKLALRLRDLMRRFINRISQARFVEGMNEDFTAFNQDGRFATAFVGTYFASNRSFQFCTAGHPPALLYRRSSNTWESLQGRRDPSVSANLPLGIMEGVEYGQARLDIEPGDMILVYTDGVTEARVAGGQMLTTNGLLSLVRSLDTSDPGRLVPSLLACLRAQISAPVGDDLTVLLARADGTGASLGNTLLAPFRLLRSVRDATRFRESVETGLQH